MAKTYYLDTCIWRDFFEDRFGLEGKPLGRYASCLFIKIMKENIIVLFSDLIVKELSVDYDMDKINEMFNLLFFSKILRSVSIEEGDYKKAREIADSRKLPLSDVIHAIIADRNNAILITRDRHFDMLRDVVESKKPEEA